MNSIYIGNAHAAQDAHHEWQEEQESIYEMRTERFKDQVIKSYDDEWLVFREEFERSDLNDRLWEALRLMCEKGDSRYAADRVVTVLMAGLDKHAEGNVCVK